MRHRISQVSFVLIAFLVLLGAAPPEISPTQGVAGHPFTLIDPQEARLADGAVAVFQTYGIEFVVPLGTHKPHKTAQGRLPQDIYADEYTVVVPLGTHKPHKTAQGRLPQDIYAGEYTVLVRNLDGSEFVIGTFTVLEEPLIEPSVGPTGTPFTITDPQGRIEPGSVAMFYEGGEPSAGTPALNVQISSDGTTLTGNTPSGLVEHFQYDVSVRPSIGDPSYFADLAFFVTFDLEPLILPTFALVGDTFIIFDPQGRIEQGDLVYIYVQGSDPSSGTPANNIVINSDGTKLTGTYPDSLSGGSYYVSIRPTMNSASRFRDLAFFAIP